MVLMTRIFALVAFSAYIVFADCGVRAGEFPKGVSAGIGFENGGHESTGPYKMLGYIQLSDKLGLGETLQIDTTNSDDFHELEGVKISLDQPLGDRWFISLAGAYDHTHPGGATGRIFDQLTRNEAYLGSLNYYVASTEKLTAILSGGVSYVDAETKKTSKFPNTGALGVPFIPNENYNQRTRDVTGSLQLKYNASEDVGIFASFSVGQGVDWDDPVSIRVGADNTPTVYSASASYTQNLPKLYQLVVEGSGQWTRDRLNQQKMFSLGGSEYATAYRSGEQVGDIGVGYHVELNKLGVTSIRAIGDVYYKPFVFFDGGITRINDPTNASERGTKHEMSAGLGLSLEGTNGMHGGLQVAFPLTGGEIFENGDEETRVLFSVGWRK
jgi:hemolysin activation/secretion protein